VEHFVANAKDISQQCLSVGKVYVRYMLHCFTLPSSLSQDA